MISQAEINKQPAMQLFLILSLCLISVVIFSLLGAVSISIFYGYELTNLSDYSDPNTIAGLKLLQLFSALGLFIIPPIVYAMLVSKDIIKKLSLKEFSQAKSYGLVILLMFISMPIMSWIIEINTNMSLPGFLNEIEQWMRNSETKAMDLTKAFLTFDDIGGFVFTFILVAIIPAIGEELLFRGVLQKIFIQWTKNPHWGVWVTAFLFSALHMQFFGFFPRMLLGAVFGYLFLWSKSLWLPILAHFINNGTVVILSYIYPDSIDEMESSLFTDTTTNIIISLISLSLVLGVLWLFRRVNYSSNDMQPSDE